MQKKRVTRMSERKVWERRWATKVAIDGVFKIASRPLLSKMAQSANAASIHGLASLGISRGLDPTRERRLPRR